MVFWKEQKNYFYKTSGSSFSGTSEDHSVSRILLIVYFEY
jgi:hypothetical protein